MMTFDSQKMSGDEIGAENCERSQLILGEEDWNERLRQAEGMNGEGLRERQGLG